MNIVLENGKYTIIQNIQPKYEFKALRYGEEWRNLTGDGMILALCHRIEELEEEIQRMKNLEWERIANDE
jgi:hypothetical protein